MTAACVIDHALATWLQAETHLVTQHHVTEETTPAMQERCSGGPRLTVS